MKVLCFIDNLGPGGAQRQLCGLALHFKSVGLDVDMLTYHGGGFFEERLVHSGIRCRVVRGGSGLRRVAAVRACFNALRPDVVLAFLPMPCLYAELASMIGKRWGLVVGERSSVPAGSRLRRFLLTMHRLADAVTANSHTNRMIIEGAVPALCGRVITIYNAVDLVRFSPGEDSKNRTSSQVRLVAAGNYRRVKNADGLARALRLMTEGGEPMVRVDWYGDALDAGDRNATLYEDLKNRVAALGVDDRLMLHGVTHDIVSEYRQADAVILPSLLEGLPNTVCEGMACGLPILASSVSDVPRIVGEGWNGYLFDPSDPQDIARAIRTFAGLSPAARAELGSRSREAAVLMFDEKVVTERWLRVLELAAQRRAPHVGHWIPADAAAGPNLQAQLSGSGRLREPVDEPHPV